MSVGTEETAKLFAVSDLHMGYADNRQIVDRLQPTTDQDWLLVAGDVGEVAEQIQRTLAVLRSRFPRWCGCPATTSCGRTSPTR